MRTREFELTPRVGDLLVVAWALLTVAATVARRGELFEMALIGVAGTVAWSFVAGLRLTVTRGALLALCFVAPLLNTWPFRVFDAQRASVGVLGTALTTVPSLLVLVAAVFHTGWRRRVPRLLLAAAVLLAVGGVTSTVVAADRASAAAATWLIFFVAPAFGLLFVQAVDRPTARRFLGVAVVSATAPAFVAIAAYILEFGLPHDTERLVVVKRLLYRPHFFQEVTMGNVGHIVDFVLLFLGPALGLALVRGRLVARVAAATAALALAAALVLSASRSGLVVGIAVAGALTLSALRTRRAAVLLPAAITVALALVVFTGQFRHSVATLIPATPTPTQPATTTPGVTPPSSSGASASEQMRLSAVRTAWTVYRHHVPFGVGTAQYLAYDPVHGAAHSLALQLLAENGIFGAAGLLVLLLFVGAAALRLLVRADRRDDAYVVGLGCCAGLSGYLLNGLAAGSLLAMGPVVLWAVALWLLAAGLALEAE